ncbi:hypothetical protein HK405_013146, partial [Cladochytrium tenue]
RTSLRRITQILSENTVDEDVLESLYKSRAGRPARDDDESTRPTELNGGEARTSPPVSSSPLFDHTDDDIYPVSGHGGRATAVVEVFDDEDEDPPPATGHLDVRLGTSARSAGVHHADGDAGGDAASAMGSPVVILTTATAAAADADWFDRGWSQFDGTPATATRQRKRSATLEDYSIAAVADSLDRGWSQVEATPANLRNPEARTTNAAATAAADCLDRGWSQFEATPADSRNMARPPDASVDPACVGASSSAVAAAMDAWDEFGRLWDDEDDAS